MNNGVSTWSTTILHQAISSKGDTVVRPTVISAILHRTPEAAAIESCKGSLPLHVITQRVIKMDARTKERLISEFVQAFPGALLKKTGASKRTPLHILFTGVWPSKDSRQGVPLICYGSIFLCEDR
jgi:hypothetical protein